MTSLDLASRESVATEVARTLVAYLLSGQVRPGERITSERKLAEVLGVGRSVVREALKSLTLLGLLEVRQGDGTYLKRPDSQLLPWSVEWGLLLSGPQVMDLVEARHQIEVITATLAAQRRDDAALADLRQLLEQMRRARTPEEFVKADVAFHLRLAEAANNKALSGILFSIRSLLHVWISRVAAAEATVDTLYGEHETVFNAVALGDPEAATAAMTRHMEAATSRLRKTLGEKEQ